MSDLPPRIKVVCEGPTDLVVIESALNNILAGREFELVLLQPETSEVGSGAGPYGGGWKGVRGWSLAQKEEAGSLHASSAMLQTDLFILHLDADVADDKEVNCRVDCPPPHATTNRLRAVALTWLGEPDLPPRAVFCTPSKCTEAWVIAALYLGDKFVKAGTIECRDEPEALLAGKPADEKLLRRKKGKKAHKYDKDEDAYRARAEDFKSAWPAVCGICTEAERFSKDVVTVMGAGG